MPVVRVTLIEGYCDDTRQALARRITDAVRGTMAAPAEGVTVVIEEVKPTSYMRGGTTRVPGAPSPDPEALVRDYLAAMERRDLETAASFLAPEFEMTFPGGAVFTRVEDLPAWAATRYRFVTKTFEGTDVAFQGATTVVICRGWLAGEWTDGTPFSNVRFVDRFEIVDGRIARQTVWNDLAETRPAATSPG
ncbi:DUF4440 domain-containing protein [Stappia sp.]|uniref:DUF4440 domain-containing protein n=1 Tax=Stappia sp. TaxID=1870903 RepID=UPI0032D98C1A